VKRRHSMSFGAERQSDDAWRFRFWAPGAHTVDLCLDDPLKETLLPLKKEADGWFSITTNLVKQGTLYRYRIDGGQRVPDPASRFQPHDVHGASQVVDPEAWEWKDASWRGRPWEETVIYELHIGTFTEAGTYAGAKQRLDELVDLGITAIELMPLADFPGRRNWGYDGVLPFAPDSIYGTPEELKDLIQSAHARGLMVFLDVVYNHFGPDGNFLHLYAPAFFTDRHHTPWGAAINFDGPNSAPVRDFFIHNALYWIEEYHLDGLRLDAVHAIIDDSQPDILQDIARAIMTGPGASRQVHLVLENEHNAARYLGRDSVQHPRWYTAQWNDDIHHALHVLTSGEQGGYYEDFADHPARHLGRCLTEGFAYQDDPSRYRHGVRRGETSRHLPATAFVSFLQNHDQIGNRAMGERITRIAPEAAVRAATAILLLAPSPPLLFMGQEWGAPHPFLFFCDFGPELAAAVTKGRRNEFARFPEFSDETARARIPDPNDEKTFLRTRLDRESSQTETAQTWLRFHRELLGLRAREVVPRLRNLMVGKAGYETLDGRGLRAHWQLADGSTLTLLANMGEQTVTDIARPGNRVLYPLSSGTTGDFDNTLPPWSVWWFLDVAKGGRS
jgi:maltooligosyltrehalose trehalohydrolase